MPHLSYILILNISIKEPDWSIPSSQLKYPEIILPAFQIPFSDILTSTNRKLSESSRLYHNPVLYESVLLQRLSKPREKQSHTGSSNW